MNYELVWKDSSPAAVQWIQEEFDALWSSPSAVPLADFVMEDIGRLAERRVLPSLDDWAGRGQPVEPAPAVIEAPVYRKEAGLWEHQKYFVKLVLDHRHGPLQKARFVLADQVGLGKTLQLAMSALLIALTGQRPILVICPKTLVWQWQGEMRDLLAMPSAVWDGKRWVDERGIEHPAAGPESVRHCPRRVGIVSSGLITRRSEVATVSRSLIPAERELLQRFAEALEANQERDPKYAVVRQCLLERGWLRLGCIVFSQYRDSIQWLAEQLTEELPDEPIAIYSGPTTSGIMLAGHWTPKTRDELKRMVAK